MLCYLYQEPTYLFIAPDLPSLLYYAHFPAITISLLIGIFVFVNSPKKLLNQLLFLIAISFSIWVTLNLFAWTNTHSDFLLFIWSLYGVIQAIISILCIYFIKVFSSGEDISFKTKLLFILLLLPVFLLSPTDFNVSGFNLDWCDAFEYENIQFVTYYSLLGVLAMIWIAADLFKRYRTADYETKTQVLLMGVGIEIFLFFFFTIVYLTTILTGLRFFEDSRLEFIGIFGMTFFMVMMGVLIVRFNTFSIGMHVAKALVIALVLLTASKYTFSTSTTDLVLTTITLIFVIISGLFLIRSVRREIEQREEIEKLVVTLDKANARLKVLDKMKSEFVSIASHQLRSPLTSIRGYASMLLEGSYGKIPDKAQQALERIAESSKFMVSSVEDYLNVSRIESGNMKYEMDDFNFAETVEQVVDDIRPTAIKKGLLLTYRSDISSNAIVNADIGKVRQALHNLINNSVKYTNKGSVVVTVSEHKKDKLIWADISDTGIGMSEDTKDSLFAKFSRAKDANKTNTSGTGLGLFVAKQMIVHMGGDVTADSEGEGKGSTFTLKLPLQQ